jgi:hypothetical protein
MVRQSEALENVGCESLSRWPAREWRHKGCDLGDQSAVEGEHVERFRRVPLLLGLPAVVAECQLSVGAKGNETPPLEECGSYEEGPDRVPAPIPGPKLRHRKCGVLGELRDDRVDVCSFPRLDVALDDVADAVVAELAQRGLLAPIGKPLPYCFTCAAEGAGTCAASNVAVLSVHPIVDVVTHADDPNPSGGPNDPLLFSRDCLEATIAVPKVGEVTFLVNHLKSKLVVRTKGMTDQQYKQQKLAGNQRRLRHPRRERSASLGRDGLAGRDPGEAAPSTTTR